jgi:hypothetical protein
MSKITEKACLIALIWTNLLTVKELITKSKESKLERNTNILGKLSALPPNSQIKKILIEIFVDGNDNELFAPN